MLTLLLLLVAPGTASARTCEATGADKVWGCPAFGGWIASRNTGPADEARRLVVIGDSLVQRQGDELPNMLGQYGYVHTAGIGGAQFYHWNQAFYDNHRDIGLVAQGERARHIILALGTNDAHMLATGRVGYQDIANQIWWGMTRAADETQGCVVLVLPSAHDTHANETQSIRDMLNFLSVVGNNTRADKPFRTADWNEQSIAHDDWFTGPGNPHHSDTGKLAYRQFLTFFAEGARNGSLGC